MTGDSTERVDTRVLQALYSFEPRDLPIDVGQQMDAFIEALPVYGGTALERHPPATLELGTSAQTSTWADMVQTGGSR